MSQEDIIPDFFSRNIGSVTSAQQQRLQQATVTVIGCGGLGGFVIEELARLGVGSLRICDPDTFCTSNINRQLYAEKKSLGQHKAVVAAKRVLLLHGQTKVLTVTTPFQEAKEQLLTETDAVVDCLDNDSSRRELARSCNRYRLPLVHGAVHQWYGQVGVQPVGGTLVRDLYKHIKHDESAAAPSVLCCTVALIASLQAVETCKLLLNMESDLHDCWMCVDMRRLSFDIIDNGKQTEKPNSTKQ